MPMPKPNRPDHVVVGEHGKLTCLNCGETHTPKLPMEIDHLVKRIRAFCNLHASCTAEESEATDAN